MYWSEAVKRRVCEIALVSAVLCSATAAHAKITKGPWGQRVTSTSAVVRVEVTPAATMCGPCGGVYEKIKDRQVNCGINACKNKWSWSKDEQIQAYAKGLPNEPPRRMCDTCKGQFGGIADREVRCRASGCKNTWTWSRGDQLDACLAGKQKHHVG